MCGGNEHRHERPNVWDLVLLVGPDRYKDAFMQYKGRCGFEVLRNMGPVTARDLGRVVQRIRREMHGGMNAEEFDTQYDGPDLLAPTPHFKQNLCYQMLRKANPGSTAAKLAVQAMQRAGLCFKVHRRAVPEMAIDSIEYAQLETALVRYSNSYAAYNAGAAQAPPVWVPPQVADPIVVDAQSAGVVDAAFRSFEQASEVAQNEAHQPERGAASANLNEATELVAGPQPHAEPAGLNRADQQLQALAIEARALEIATVKQRIEVLQQWLAAVEKPIAPAPGAVVAGAEQTGPSTRQDAAREASDVVQNAIQPEPALSRHAVWLRSKLHVVLMFALFSWILLYSAASDNSSEGGLMVPQPGSALKLSSMPQRSVARAARSECEEVLSVAVKLVGQLLHRFCGVVRC